MLRRFFGSRNERTLRRHRRAVARINGMEPALQALSDAELRAKTAEFRSRLAAGEEVDALLPEGFAVVREAARRTVGMRPFDVQLIGGMALHEGNIAEMATGEGKTLAATLPIYLNALSGQGVHLITVNDYLAQRDADWMEPVYRFLGMEVGTVLPGQDQEARRAAYAADITYGTNNEFGFDYLRDNMTFSLEDRVQRDLHYAIVDEVDSILIDEARTPLIISGAAEDSSELYRRINRLVPGLLASPGDIPENYSIDEKQRQVELTEEGHAHIEQQLIKVGLLPAGDSLYSPVNLGLLHHVHSALRAHVLYQRDVEYIIREKEIVLIDEHTGRTMQGRRLSEGLHQALEAKENLPIQSESQTLASTTFQNFFRLYEKLAGMTGTADTEAAEFNQIYGLDVVVIPTNQPVHRKDLNDLVYLSREEKFDALVQDIREYREREAPVLVGTASIESSEIISELLRRSDIPHQVLNAKQHQREAEIITQAGRPGAVTIATNMAGRGTDIVLGGNVEAEITAADLPDAAAEEPLRTAWQTRHKQVVDAGGLQVLGTERHESRRIDNQLRGRSGRQGDPGLSRFYLSMEDDLMRIFLSDRVKQFMQNLGLERGDAIEHRMVTRAIEKAQRRVESRNFEIRKQLLEYDDIADVQRKVVYGQRIEILQTESLGEALAAMRTEVLDDLLRLYVRPESLHEEWEVPGLESALRAELGLEVPVAKWLEEDESLYEESLRRRLGETLETAWSAKVEVLGEEASRLEKYVVLQVLDTFWKQHLSAMGHMRQGIHLRAYAQRNPKQEYKREAFVLFQEMLQNIKREAVRFLMHIEVRQADEIRQAEESRRERDRRLEMHREEAGARVAGGGSSAPAGAGKPAGRKAVSSPRQQGAGGAAKVGRNQPCSCGSGRKYKHCHGR